MVLPGGEAFVAVARDLLVTLVLFTVTLHLAATFVVGDVSVSRALLAAPLPAAVLVLGARPAPVWLATAVAVGVDLLAIAWSYEVDRRLAVGVTVAHFVATVLLVVSLYGLASSL